MVSQLMSHRKNPLKRRGATNVTIAPTKKSRILLMKQLAKKYYRDKIKKVKKFDYFNIFYEQNKLIFPWLKKDALRYHIRAINYNDTTTSSTTTKGTTTTHDQDPNFLETTIIDQHQVSHTWFGYDIIAKRYWGGWISFILNGFTPLRLRAPVHLGLYLTKNSFFNFVIGNNTKSWWSTQRNKYCKNETKKRKLC